MSKSDSQKVAARERHTGTYMRPIALSERNLRRNHARITAAPTDLPAFFRRFPEREWLLAGAGPSLDRAWPELIHRQTLGARLAVVDQQAAAVVARGLRPDVVFTCEPRPTAYFAHHARLSAPPVLIATTNAHPLQLTQFTQNVGGDLCFVNWDWDGPRHPGLPALPPGGNVFNLMLAVLGARRQNSLRCYGNDYAASPDRFYAHGAAADEIHRRRQSRIWNLETYYQTTIRTLPVRADGARTTAAFLRYADWQNQYAELLRREGVTVTSYEGARAKCENNT